MTGAESGDDRLSSTEFEELIQHLPMEEVFLIEYQLRNNVWHKLFIHNRTNMNKFTCNLCHADSSCFKNLIAHINGHKHVRQMETVKSLFHPEYTHPKNTKTDKADTPTCSKKDGDKTKNVGKQEKTTNAADDEARDTANVMNKPFNEIQTVKTDSKTKIANLVKNPAALRKSETAYDIVKNPMAASLTVIDDNADDKPRYETDKVITPSVNKSNIIKDNRKPSPKKDPPLFSSKTYSSNPCDDDVRGILGVEYVIKLINKTNEFSPRYECGLCEQVLDAFAMQRHLEGYNHRLKFCEKHFPTAIRHYRQYMQGIPENDLFKVMTPVLAKLAIAIEKHHGRNLPYECYESDFILHRHDILAKAFSCRHASEQYGPTFTHVLDSKEIDQYINERNKYVQPTYSRSAIFDNKPEGNHSEITSVHNISVHKDRHKNVIRDNNKMLVGKATKLRKRVEPFNTQFVPSNNFNDFSMSLPMKDPNFMLSNHTQPHTMLESFIPNSVPVMHGYTQNNINEPYVPHAGNYSAHAHIQPEVNFSSYTNQRRSVDDQTYNKMVDEFLQGTLKGKHGEHSRKRSPYPSSSSGPPPKRQIVGEIQQTNKRQHVEIQQPNKDYEIEKKIAALDVEFRKYRNDPESYPCYNDEWQKFWKKRKEELIAAGCDHRNYNYQPEWVIFIKDRIEVVYREKLENIKKELQEQEGLPQFSGAHPNTCTRSNDTNTIRVPIAELKPEASKHSQVVSVLRLMAALEENLGSLGPKIITLLSKALQLEKTNRGDITLLNDENCTIIETVKEKFKGLLLTGIVEGSKQRAIKKAVEDAEALLSSTQQFRATNHSKTVQQKPTPQSQSTPSISDILRFLRAQSDQK